MTNNRFLRFTALILCFLLIFEQSGFAQIASQLDVSGYMSQLRQSLTADRFRPLHLRYLSYDNLNNTFKLLLDKGDYFKIPNSKSQIPNKSQIQNPKFQTKELEQETKELLNYFFIGVSLPNDAFWVNLRPDSPDNIIDPLLASTDAGKVLLESDLQLKKDTAKFTSPQTPEGKEYWDKLYQKAAEIFGSQNLTIPTLTRPWIVPDEIIIRESETNAYIYKATLKVMLEEDYLVKSQIPNHKSQTNPNIQIQNYKQYEFKDDRLKELNAFSSQLIRETIIPKLTKEINTAKRYAPLRQVYYSLIMAQWFKQKFRGKGGLYSWLIDRKNLAGLTSKESWSKDSYFKAYQKSFKDGEYNFQEPAQTLFGQTIRSYFSGGAAFDTAAVSAAVANGSRVTVDVDRPLSIGLSERNPQVAAEGGTAQDLAASRVMVGQPRQITESADAGIASGAAVSTQRPFTAKEIREGLNDGSLDLRWMTKDKAGEWKKVAAAEIPDEAQLVLDGDGGYLLLHGQEGARYTFQKVDSYYLIEGGGRAERDTQARQNAPQGEGREAAKVGHSNARIESIVGSILKEIARLRADKARTQLSADIDIVANILRAIAECFNKGWSDSAGQIAVEAIKNQVPGIGADQVKRAIAECFN
ncbi:MAG: hypothetical protein FJZ13_01315, partial [Candidatus Omnitrophica bacterium]|nr:hypothetical protein [Candidatus Omnitrophota bacterium]